MKINNKIFSTLFVLLLSLIYTTSTEAQRLPDVNVITLSPSSATFK